MRSTNKKRDRCWWRTASVALLCGTTAAARSGSRVDAAGKIHRLHWQQRHEEQNQFCAGQTRQRLLLPPGPRFENRWERIRGGSSSYNNDPRQQQSYGNYGSQGGGYSGDGYRDDDDYYYGSGGGTEGVGEEDDYYYYDDRGSSSADRPRQQHQQSGLSSMMDSVPAMFQKGDRRIGLPLVGAGSVVTLLGMSLFFNKALLRLGNLLFVLGVAVTMGLSRTAAFFFKPEKLRATACLGLGIFLVFVGSPVLGMILEVFGLLNLFGNMFPVILAVGKTLPGIGPLLNNLGNNNSKSNKRNKDRQRDRYDYDDGDYNEYYDDPQSSQGYYGDDGYGGGGDQRYDDDGYNDGGGDRGYY